MKTSKSGVAFIAHEESMVDRDHDGNPETYLDVAGNATVGFGHKVKPREDFPAELPAAEALRILSKDVGFAERTVNSAINGAKLKQCQFDALVSFCFNVGSWNFKDSTLLKHVRAGELKLVPQEFMKWIWITNPGTGEKEISDGLQARRAKEILLWLGRL